MKEIIEKFPEIIRLLLEKISQTEYGNNNPKVKEAKNKLLNQFNEFTKQFSSINKEGEPLTEEQMEKIRELYKNIPIMPWFKK